jgi:hypothetical protein
MIALSKTKHSPFCSHRKRAKIQNSNLSGSPIPGARDLDAPTFHVSHNYFNDIIELALSDRTSSQIRYTFESSCRQFSNTSISDPLNREFFSAQTGQNPRIVGGKVDMNSEIPFKLQNAITISRIYVSVFPWFILRN